jgi:hypothetical protein
MSNKLLLLTTGGARVQLPASIDRQSTKVSPTDAAAGFRLHSDGTIDATPNSSTSLSYSEDLGSWLIKGAASDYEARLTSSGPDAFSGQAAGSWLSLGTTRDWYAQITGTGTQDCNASAVEIRDATTLQVLATMTVSMYAESTP